MLNDCLSGCHIETSLWFITLVTFITFVTSYYICAFNVNFGTQPSVRLIGGPLNRGFTLAKCAFVLYCEVPPNRLIIIIIFSIMQGGCLKKVRQYFDCNIWKIIVSSKSLLFCLELLFCSWQNLYNELKDANFFLSLLFVFCGKGRA